MLSTRAQHIYDNEVGSQVEKSAEHRMAVCCRMRFMVRRDHMMVEATRLFPTLYHIL